MCWGELSLVPYKSLPYGWNKMFISWEVLPSFLWLVSDLHCERNLLVKEIMVIYLALPIIGIINFTLSGAYKWRVHSCQFSGTGKFFHPKRASNPILLCEKGHRFPYSFVRKRASLPRLLSEKKGIVAQTPLWELVSLI